MAAMRLTTRFPFGTLTVNIAGLLFERDTAGVAALYVLAFAGLALVRAIS
jgi:hypothetical protein